MSLLVFIWEAQNLEFNDLGYLFSGVSPNEDAKNLLERFGQNLSRQKSTGFLRHFVLETSKRHLVLNKYFYKYGMDTISRASFSVKHGETRFQPHPKRCYGHLEFVSQAS